MQKRNKKGFTLVELVIVIAVIAILAGVLIGTFAGVISRANQSKAVQEWKARVDEAYVEYVADEHVSPKFVSVTTSSIEFESEGKTTNYKIETGKYVTLDETNKVYLVFTADGVQVVTTLSTSLVVASQGA